MKTKLTMILVALVCGAWAILPDPLPLFFVDDIIAAFLAAAAIIKFIKSTVLKTT